MESDEVVVAAVLHGETERFADLVERSQRSVHGVLLRLVGDADRAADLAQSAYLRAFEHLAGFRAESTFTTWVTGIAVRLARDEQRREGRVNWLPLDLAGEEEAPLEQTTRLSLDFDPSHELEAVERLEILERALAGLSAEAREVFVLRHVYDVGYDDIAEMSGVSVGTLKVRNHRARRALIEAVRRADRAGKTGEPTGED